MAISSIRGLGRYLKNNAGFSSSTIDSLIVALGFHPRHGTQDEFRELSKMLVNCTDHDSTEAYKRLFKYNEKVSFYKTHQKDIIAHLEQQAYEMKLDIIFMIRNNIIYDKKYRLTESEVAKALWHNDYYLFEPLMLYNYLTKYVLYEIAWIWYDYLEENPD
jgi:hypothetical protein